IALRRFDGKLARQQVVARIAGLDRHYVAAVSQLIDVFLKNDLHLASLSSCSGPAKSFVCKTEKKPSRLAPRATAIQNSKTNNSGFGRFGGGRGMRCGGRGMRCSG